MKDVKALSSGRSTPTGRATSIEEPRLNRGRARWRTGSATPRGRRGTISFGPSVRLGKNARVIPEDGVLYYPLDKYEITEEPKGLASQASMKRKIIDRQTEEIFVYPSEKRTLRLPKGGSIYFLCHQGRPVDGTPTDSTMVRHFA
jgi:hypothetical protein